MNLMMKFVRETKRLTSPYYYCTFTFFYLFSCRILKARGIPLAPSTELTASSHESGMVYHDIYMFCIHLITSTVKYRQSAPLSRPFVVVLCRWSPVCRSYDTNFVHILHAVQTIRTFERTRAPHKNLPLTLVHHTHFVAFCRTIFLSLDPGCKIKVGRSRETGRSGGTLRYTIHT